MTLPLGKGPEMVVELKLGNKESVESSVPLIVLIRLIVKGKQLQTRTLLLGDGPVEVGCGRFQ